MEGFTIKCNQCGKEYIITSHIGIGLNDDEIDDDYVDRDINLQGDTTGEVYIICKCGNTN